MAYEKKTKEEKELEIKMLIENTEKKIDAYFDSPESIKEYLSFMEKFHKYSVNNSTLINDQFPGATGVGSYNFWKDKGFKVNKGEKGIKIFVPKIGKDKFENKDGEIKAVDKATKEEKEKIKQGVYKINKGKTYFIQGYVFDISQTNAKTQDLPEIFPNKWLDGNVKDYKTIYKGLEKIAEKIGVKIIEPQKELGAGKGVSYTFYREVGLNPRNSELQNVKTLLHELTHAKLHTIDKINDYQQHEKEFQAELTAHTVCSHFGIDTSEYSLKYLHDWTMDKTLNDKKELLKEVKETSLEYIDILEAELLNKQNKDIMKENISEKIIGGNSMERKEKAKSLDIEPREGDVLLNWNKKSNHNKSLDAIAQKEPEKAKSLDIEPREGDVLLNWGNKRHKHNKSLDEIEKKDAMVQEEPVKEKEVKKEPIKKESQEIHKSEKSKDKSKDDNFMKEYLEKQRRRSVAKEKQKDLGMER